MAHNQAEFDALVKSLRDGSFVDDGIYLSDNRLSNSDAEQLFSALAANPQVAAKIKSLNLSGNQLSSVHIPVTLVALQSLYLERNRLESVNIPPTLVALQYLFLSDNQLRSVGIPATFVALQYLYLDNNQLLSVNIPPTLVALQKLFLDNNQLESVSIPVTLVALQRIHLESNQLESVKISPTFVALQAICLERNHLESVNIPPTLVALKTLFLENNPLSSLARQQLTAMRHLWRECNIRFDNPAVEEPQISDDMLTHWRETYFSPQLISRNSLTPERAREAIRDITTVYLFLNKNGLPAGLAPMIAKYLLPLPKRTDQSIQAYSLLELFNMLPENERPKAEMLALLSEHEEALKQNITTAQELLAVEDARFAQKLATHPMYQRLLALNRWFADNKKDIRNDRPDTRHLPRPIAWVYQRVFALGAYLAANGKPCTYQRALKNALSYGDDEVKAAAKSRLRPA